MKVMCFSYEDFTGGYAVGDIEEYMQIGDEFEVEAECVGYGKNDFAVECYKLKGINHQVFDRRNFAILPEADADEINAAEAEAIVPAPVVESDPLSIEEKALQAYINTYELTGDEHRSAQVYYQTLQNPQP